MSAAEDDVWAAATDDGAGRLSTAKVLRELARIAGARFEGTGQRCYRIAAARVHALADEAAREAARARVKQAARRERKAGRVPSLSPPAAGDSDDRGGEFRATRRTSSNEVTLRRAR